MKNRYSSGCKQNICYIHPHLVNVLEVGSAIIKTDFLIIGSGLAGLNAALEAAIYGSVVLITKSKLNTSSSYWAQGGVAAVLNESDSFESHIRDTHQAGRGYCNSEAVDILVKEGSQRIKEMIESGIPFDKNNGKLSLGLEGGHSARRILHADGAATGKAMVDFLITAIRESPKITIIENAFVYDLISEQKRCYGALTYLYKKGETLQIRSNTTILATGGYSGLYSRTTNPHTSTGDGLMLAWNHGAVLKDLEFVQFHPTVFKSKNGNSFLISEALRGEGARLFNTRGERFMEKFPDSELSPRDIVSKEILKQISAQEEEFVYLDVTHLKSEKLRERFPGLISRIEACGIDISRQGIPVAPAAHYCIGGIETDTNGQTCVDSLYACGEVASTGVHGANRLASNSLLECLVFSKRAVEHARKHQNKFKIKQFSTKPFTMSPGFEMPFMVQKQVVTSMLNQYAGIERNHAGLFAALEMINRNLKSAMFLQGNEYYFLRMKDMINSVELIVQAALHRKESRGVHFRTDYPLMNEAEMTPIRFQKDLYHEKQMVS